MGGRSEGGGMDRRREERRDGPVDGVRGEGRTEGGRRGGMGVE